MAASTNERNHILQLIEAGKLSAEQAGQLLDSMELEHSRPVERNKNRLVRVRVTNLASGRQKINVTIPASLINVGLRLATRLAPQIRDSALEDLLRAVERGSTGRLLDIQDLEEGERVEIFTE